MSLEFQVQYFDSELQFQQECQPVNQDQGVTVLHGAHFSHGLQDRLVVLVLHHGGHV